MDEISKVIRYYLTQVQMGKNSPHLFTKFEKTFLKYFADQMKDNFPGRVRRVFTGNITWSTPRWSQFTDTTSASTVLTTADFGTLRINTGGTTDVSV